MVTVLTAVMIGGLLTIVALLVIRLGGASSPALPDTIVLPEGVQATAFTRGADWYAIVSQDDEILIFNTSDNSLRQRISVTNQE